MRCRSHTPTGLAQPSWWCRRDPSGPSALSPVVSTTQVLVGKTEVVSTVDVIATDFRRVKVIPSRWMPTDIGLLIDQDYVAVAFFRSFPAVPDGSHGRCRKPHDRRRVGNGDAKRAGAYIIQRHQGVILWSSAGWSIRMLTAFDALL